VLSYLLTGPLLYGGLGWLLDRWLGTAFLAPLGIVGGMGLALYLVWVRYGTAESSTRSSGR
jgi:F0F1-type ATP synthase assembly protein I